MGKSPNEAPGSQSLAGHLAHLNWDNFAAHIAKTYGIDDEAEIWSLMEQLDGIVMRDQRPPPGQFVDAKAQRKAVHTAAKEIVSKARAVEDGLHNLEAALFGFNTAVGDSFWSAAMLEEAFDIPYVEPNAVDAPELFDLVRGFFIKNAEALKEISADLGALSALPVRPRRRTNNVRNHVLRQALLACRKFWKDQLRRSWSRSSLTAVGPARSKQPDQLQGECERFVVDLLTAAGIAFEPRTLNGAWAALEKAAPASGSRRARRRQSN